MYLVRITDNTLITVTLSGQQSPIVGVTYFPSRGDGQTVTETAVIVCEGSASAIINVINNIEQLFEDAAARLDLLAPKVYVEASVTAALPTRRSEIKSGSVDWSKTPGRHKLDATSNLVELAVIWTRVDWWEASIEDELFLSSGTMSERQGGVDVYNNDNASSSTNWVGINSTRVDGALPAPLRLRILNNAGASISPHNIHIGHNVNSSPGSMDCWLLGSEAVGGASVSWSATDHSSLLYVFPLNTTLLGQAQGRYFRALVAFTSATANINLRAGIWGNLGGVYRALRLGKEFNNGVGTANRLMDLGSFPIPPGGYATTTANAAFVISVRSTVPGSLNIDFVNLMATDSFRRLEQIGYNLAVLDGVEDNGVDGGAYAIVSGNKASIVQPYFKPIYVQPRKVQRLYILFDESTTEFVAGRKMKVQAWYRPRVRSL